MKKILFAIVALMMMGFGTMAMVPERASAARAEDPLCSTITDTDLRQAAGCGDTSTEIDSPIRTVINILLYVVGILAVVMIIVSGLKMTMSAGDAGAVQKAKNTLIYSVIGLIIVILAYAIVNFVITKIGA